MGHTGVGKLHVDKIFWSDLDYLMPHVKTLVRWVSVDTEVRGSTDAIGLAESLCGGQYG